MAVNDSKVYAQISSYIGRLIREKFGKGPTSVYVTIKHPYMTIYLKDFLAPMERVLLEKGEKKRVEETRDVLMEELLPEIMCKLEEIVSIKVKDLHYDWNLENRSGIIFGCVPEGTSHEHRAVSPLPAEVEGPFYKEINEASKRGQKMPERTEVFVLNDRTILTKRTGILVNVEKELIKNQFTEELKLTKRPMEKRLIDQGKLEDILGKDIDDTFVDWNFDQDIGYFVFITTSKKEM
ncbi:DUF2294 domain-containing protein [Salipaludibacillus agaradhaerens]|uniref:DUF2294 domain-containing protein n=1 Tax=Salipaludibacillus agaradhaerens TaxID=76935 RepID=UPI002151BA7C|nr:DUF2294 domain-containing protein [Salipaludibacillus agaradhaerens]MCR6105179.1 DUF2294 domain-containing protein [Salipaludibacillus agaradhaerens]MCR6117224.1 DUF2294 domain-containing protein [Salipaludibacillus agaradhaerens]UJW56419.1 DUF2294 domain-containing protein [Bacillus sp. A116_S68]